jgi:hypothetical protein
MVEGEITISDFTTYEEEYPHFETFKKTLLMEVGMNEEEKFIIARAKKYFDTAYTEGNWVVESVYVEILPFIPLNNKEIS